MGVIFDNVAKANCGENEKVICRMPSGWAVMGDVQFLEGYCLLLPDPVVSSLNDLKGEKREQYLKDLALLGDAVLEVTGALRINYEILGNVVPELHAHVFPRFSDEPDELKTRPVWFYNWETAPKYDESVHGELKKSIEKALSCYQS